MPAARKPDSTDAEHLRQVVESNGYSWIAARVARMIEQEFQKLLHSENERETARSQGAIAALRAVTHVPKILADEIAAREAKK